MEKLLPPADQQASIADSISTHYDEATFIKYMDKKPVWEFYSMSKDEYLLKSREGKLSMISDYYNQMKKGEKLSFFVFFVVWICHFLKFIADHFLNNGNGTFLSVTVSSSAGMGTLKKANMLFLTKEATNKDQTLKTQMLMSTTDDKKNSEAIWHLFRSKGRVYYF